MHIDKVSVISASFKIGRSVYVKIHGSLQKMYLDAEEDFWESQKAAQKALQGPRQQGFAWKNPTPGLQDEKFTY